MRVDWKRLVGELALIIGGVLIALAFDSWRQGRAELARETAYFEQMLADTRETEARLGATIAGDIHLLRNDSIRFAVITYLALLDATAVILKHTERLVRDITDRINRRMLYHARTPAGEWTQHDVRAVFNDPEIISAMQSQIRASSNRVNNLTRLREPTANLIRQLEEVLEGK